jgi:hypothetical protein
MSQVSHPTISIRSQVQAHRVAWLAALLALVATATVVLILAIDGDQSTTNSVTGQPQLAVRPDGGPNEAAVAASVGSRPSTGPSESRIAASVGGAGTARPTGGPDESTVASSLSKSPQAHAGPDEAATAAAISGR